MLPSGMAYGNPAQGLSIHAPARSVGAGTLRSAFSDTWNQVAHLEMYLVQQLVKIDRRNPAKRRRMPEVVARAHRQFQWPS
jgi:hypothetical protein